MGHKNLREAIEDLKSIGDLVEIDVEIDPRLEAGAIQRRVYEAGGPALLFKRVKRTPFPLLANLFGKIERARHLFRDRLDAVKLLVDAKVEPPALLRRPWRALGLPRVAWHLLPARARSGPVLEHRTTLSRLPELVSWPRDGGPFVTLPQVYTEDPARPGFAKSNLGMYRVQLAGNDYVPDREVGLHYQIHRGIGVHHAAAIERGGSLPVNVIVGGPPALALAAVMPLPEGLPELSFAGALSGRRIRMVPAANGLPAPAEADFVISGHIRTSAVKPEGPFGDHLGYYSLVHDFPVMTVEAVHHRPGAVWPFTTVGRPPQEDTTFGQFIHELTGPLVPTVLPGVSAVHAVDAAGVHPLLLAIGSERYVPYATVREPRELLTQANAILGQGQMSLAKYLFIVAREDAPDLDVHDVPAFLRHLLERFDPANDLHFQTRTTIDTLDYSGYALNKGSKLAIAAAGNARRRLATSLPPEGALALPEGFHTPRLAFPGVVCVGAPRYVDDVSGAARRREFADAQGGRGLLLDGHPWIVLVDDPEFAAASVRNLLWVLFTRTDPARDVDGPNPRFEDKHWTTNGPLVFDARLKPRHAPPLEEDPEVVKRVEALAAPGGPLHGLY